MRVLTLISVADARGPMRDFTTEGKDPLLHNLHTFQGAESCA